MSDVVIYHNPRCSKSRQTLALLEEQGIEPQVVNYLDETPDAATLDAVLTKLGLEPQDIVRKKEAEYKELGLANQDLSRQAYIDILVANPKLIERPIVVNGGKAAIGRPPESVLRIL